MFTSVTNILLFFIILSFGREHYQCQRALKRRRRAPCKDVPIIPHDSSYYLNQAVCDFSSKKVINPYKNILENLTPAHKIDSVCFRCATCLAVAQQFTKAMESVQVGMLAPKEEFKLVEDTLQWVCHNGFTKFDLRSYKEQNFIMRTSSCSTHVRSNLDGHWPQKLQEVCLKYLNHMNLSTFYNNLMRKPFYITDYLCRGDGLFRDCNNVGFQKMAVVSSGNDFRLETIFKLDCLL